ncbi:MAG: hypothetical protein HXX15_03890 [Rhodopseudomonas sp.]|uniref:hypothetical protein n=1 Tax=Rhodopseudomonas sp. TaxID=1078 RepID=UPI001803AD9C|nr:hypothetical protein [Rhodopseudomonas sp.]NVN85212.1 hypothetical protein [Rhodopseudomonas sp.]
MSIRFRNSVGKGQLQSSVEKPDPDGMAGRLRGANLIARSAAPVIAAIRWLPKPKQIWLTNSFQPAAVRVRWRCRGGIQSRATRLIFGWADVVGCDDAIILGRQQRERRATPKSLSTTSAYGLRIGPRTVASGNADLEVAVSGGEVFVGPHDSLMAILLVFVAWRC